MENLKLLALNLNPSKDILFNATKALDKFLQGLNSNSHLIKHQLIVKKSKFLRYFSANQSLNNLQTQTNLKQNSRYKTSIANSLKNKKAHKQLQTQERTRAIESQKSLFLSLTMEMIPSPSFLSQNKKTTSLIFLIKANEYNRKFSKVLNEYLHRHTE